jgi:glycosyltransferase involved in cell wall biosynthesis
MSSGGGAPGAAGTPRVSVLMPTFEQAAFLPRAVTSLLGGVFPDWELEIVDDGSRDGTAAVLAGLPDDPRIRVTMLPENRGLGAALNVALDQARAPLIAYLPSDDLFHRDHLASLVALLDERPEAVLAWAGMRHHYDRESFDPLPDGLQLVQVVHRARPERWAERSELESDDLERLFWSRLRDAGTWLSSERVTCEWVSHPHQRHRVMREPVGGVNPFRQRYRVAEPLRFSTTTGDAIDERARYRRFRERPPTPPRVDGLRIVLAGELAYNPERILALEERGHRLFGLWMPEPYWYNAVGPQPFGHVEDLDRSDLRGSLRRARPDVVYALLNWQAVPFAAEVRRAAADLGVPTVWHFKEGPFICLEKGTWPDLVELTTRSDGVVHSSPEMAEWFDLLLPGGLDPQRQLVLDGDLPKAEWMDGQRAERLSAHDGEIHTVVPGRPIGLHPPDVASLAGQGIHLHFYGDFTHGQWREWIERSHELAPGHLHLHPTVSQERWVSELSRYDAGWLHVFRSRNQGDLTRATWDDLNLPARIATLALAGLPMLQARNEGSIVAAHRLVQGSGYGVDFHDLDEVGARLRDASGVERVRARVWEERVRFTFDHHADRLAAFLRRVADGRQLTGGRRDAPAPAPLTGPLAVPSPRHS